jgi:hypothetical protein
MDLDKIKLRKDEALYGENWMMKDGGLDLDGSEETRDGGIELQKLSGEL